MATMASGGVLRGAIGLRLGARILSSAKECNATTGKGVYSTLVNKALWGVNKDVDEGTGSSSCSLVNKALWGVNKDVDEGKGSSSSPSAFARAATFSALPLLRPCARPQAQASSVRSYARDSDPSDAGTHEDFAPQYKPQGSVEKVSDVIEKDVKGSKIFVYMKGVPEAPQCGFSNMVCRILDAYGVEYGSRNVLEDVEVRQGIKDYTQWPTIPQIFVDGEFVGGCDILMEMHKSGELEEVLKE